MRKPHLVTALAAFVALAPPAAGQEAPPACAFDDPARAVAARAEGRAPACQPIDRAAERPDELILPMPCGHVMHFRRVDIAVEHVLGQVRPRYGDPNAATAQSGQAATVAPWSDVLSGGFSVIGPDGGVTDRAFYLATYEVTVPQWRLFTEGVFEAGIAAFDREGPACAAHVAWLAAASPRDGYGRPDLVIPAHGMSWFEAVDFSRAYTGWLMALDRRLIENGARPTVPWQDGSPGFVRLPTEAEWEYAARDGRIGPDAQNRRLHLVAKDGEEAEPQLSEIAETEGWGGLKVGGVGRKAPNLLGLYDMLGNAEEYVLDLFRATRPDGLHGQRGGAVLRGGSPATPEGNISLGYRREAALFSISGEARAPLAGARMAVAAPFFARGAPEGQPFPIEDFSNRALEDALADSRARLTGRDLQVSDLSALIERIQSAAEPSAEEARDLLAAGLQLLEKSSAESATAARDALRQRLITGASLATSIERTGANVFDGLVRFTEIKSKILDNPAFTGEKRVQALARIDAAGAEFDNREREIEEIYRTYLENLAVLAAERDATLLEQVQAKTIERFDSPSLAKLAEAYAMQGRHLAEWRERGARDDEMYERWLFELDKTRARRDEQREK